MNKANVAIQFITHHSSFLLVSATGVCKNIVRPLEIHRINFKPCAGVKASVQFCSSGA